MREKSEDIDTAGLMASDIAFCEPSAAAAGSRLRRHGFDLHRHQPAAFFSCMYCDYKCASCPDRLVCLNPGAEERSHHNFQEMVNFVRKEALR